MSYYRIRKVHTTEILDADAVYTSDWIRVDQYDRITGLVISHEAGSLTIQQSTDAINVDFESAAIAVASDSGEEIDIKIYGEYFRAVYTNSSDAQTEFRLGIYATPMG